eukprot:TRINITY_DN4157_c0_g1_i4.p1 TRINITY_DN4157_c0_g1~~TRINITY_DN4157_c0_g1_i4.p1  ORF type:complete len:519 (+),score=64.96 TRINITY_DN4157_c0_g1_i4:354-1910(+)
MRKPFTVELGPGLLGSVFDGVQRPLKPHEAVPPRGVSFAPLDRLKKWTFRPTVQVGEHITGGDIFGRVQETPLVEHRLMLPHSLMGTVTWIAAPGEYTVEQRLIEVEFQGKCLSHGMITEWPMRKQRPSRDQLEPNTLLTTGFRVLDAFFPCAQGFACAMPGACGCGKSTITYNIARYSNVDVVVFVICGERSSDLSDFLYGIQYARTETAEPATSKICIVANSCNMQPAAVEGSIYTGAAIAEYYRDMGYRVALVADSTSRWAIALQDIASHLGEIPSDRGYPAYLKNELSKFYSRAGRVQCIGSPVREGTITVVGSVSAQGGDPTDPVFTATLELAHAFWALDTRLAQRRHYPSVNWTRSFTHCLVHLDSWLRGVDEDFISMREQALQLLRSEEELAETVAAVGKDALPDSTKEILAIARCVREFFLQQNIFNTYDKFCTLSKAAWMLRALLRYHDLAQHALVRGHGNWAAVHRATDQAWTAVTHVKYQDFDLTTSDDTHFKQVMDDLEEAFVTLD